MLVAGEENHVELAEFLIAKGADVNHPEGHGYLPTTRAFWKGNTDILRLFKRHGATCQAKILGEANAAALPVAATALVQVEFVYSFTVEPASAWPTIFGELLFAGEAGLVAVSAGCAGGVESST